MHPNEAKFYSKSFNSFSVARGKSADIDRGTKRKKKKKYSFGFSIVYRYVIENIFSLNILMDLLRPITSKDLVHNNTM